MKKNHLLRIGMVSFLTICSLVLFQGSADRQNADEQLVEEEVLTPHHRGSGDFIIWESISRYIMASYH